MALRRDSSGFNAINLQGSAQTVAEFFYYGVNSILYQRGIYSADSFKRAQKYGTTILVSADEKVNNFLTPLLAQVEKWLTSKALQKLILIIAAVQTGEILERWQFDVSLIDDESMDLDTSEGHESHEQSLSTKSDKKIRQEIADVIRQITASVTFLPLLEIPCSFDILLYTDRNLDTPKGWSESAPSYVINSRHVQLRQFSTGLHTVDTKVIYKEEEI